MYVNKTKVKTLVVRNLFDSYAKKRVVYPYDPRPLPATPTLRSAGLSRRKTVLSGKVEASPLCSPLSICLPLFLSPLYLPSSLLRHFVYSFKIVQVVR